MVQAGGLDSIEVPSRARTVPIDNGNFILQLTDSLTERRCALRVDPKAAQLPLTQILQTYLQCCPEQLLKDGHAPAASAETLRTLQDLVYVVSDSGHLGNLVKGIAFKQRNRIVSLERPPEVTVIQTDAKVVSLINIEIDRNNVGYDRNWTGFRRRRWDHHAL